MKRIFTIVVITIFSTLSCSENKKETKNTDSIEIENENKTATENAKLETSDTVNTNNNSDEESKLTCFKDVDLFWIRDLEESAQKKVGFISLSDIYPLSEHPDSLAIPNLDNKAKENQLYFKLNSSYRKRFLSKTNISETDSIYIFDYSTDALFSFSVSKLNVVGYLNIYMDINDCPCSQVDYMIGFEVPKSNLIGLGKYYSESLVFIGTQNPFMQGQMKAIAWKKISRDKFPFEKSQLTEMQKKYKNKNAIKGQAYLSETDKYNIFIQDYILSNTNLVLEDRHLIVFDKKSENIVYETLFSNSEGSSISQIGYQWIGRLLKNKPEVLFGFEDVSFGCPSIDYINSNDNKYIQINCDNRH
jgi:hypothetical protein